MKISEFIPELLKTFMGDREVRVEVWDRDKNGAVIYKTGYLIGHVRTTVHEDKIVIVCEK